MSSPTRGGFAGNWKDIAASFFKLGATSYGGPAIMGITQTELQQRRQWVSKERFLGAILGVLRSRLSST